MATHPWLFLPERAEETRLETVLRAVLEGDGWSGECLDHLLDHAVLRRRQRVATAPS
jgi:hypothetical protein